MPSAEPMPPDVPAPAMSMDAPVQSPYLDAEPEFPVNLELAGSVPPDTDDAEIWLADVVAPAPPAPVAPVPSAAVELAPPLAQPVVPQFCMACGAVRLPNRSYCDDCGFMFPVNGAVPAVGGGAGGPAPGAGDVLPQGAR
jgi:hypothetical protein